MKPNRLPSLELGRFIAASLVAAFHYSGTFRHLRHVDVFADVFRAGYAGVDYFFVLSGFVIYHVHRHDIGHPHRVRDFVLRRAIRIYPEYWAALLFMIMALTLAPWLASQGGAMAKQSLVPDALLLPINGDSIVPVSWTLRREVIFYAIFALLILRPRLGGALFVAWQAASTIGHFVLPQPVSGYVAPFADVYNLGFAMGVGMGWLFEQRPAPRPALVAALGWLAFAGAFLFEWRLGRHLPLRAQVLDAFWGPLIYSAAASVAVYGLASLDHARGCPPSKAVAVLGGCSYILYLIHIPVGWAALWIFSLGPLHLLNAHLVFAAMLVTAVAASCAGRLLFEKPLTLWLHARLVARRPTAALAADRRLASIYLASDESAQR